MAVSFWEMVSHDLAVDLGTANTIIAVRGKGIILREPSVIALHSKTKAVVAVGEAAKKMVGKTPMTILAIYPLREGVISDFDAAATMLSHFIVRAHKSPSLVKRIPRPRVVIGIPSSVTEVERRAVSDAASSAGAREVFLVEEPMAAAVGAGLPVEHPAGSMVVDIGGGTTEIAVISLGGIVTNQSLRVAGSRMDQAIINYAKVNFHLLLGERTAEEVKMAVGSASPFEGEDGFKVLMRGRDLETGLPKSLEVGAWEIRAAISPVIKQVVEAVKEQVEATPPELVADIIRRGITLTGGASQIRGLDELLTEEVGIPVRQVDDPMTSVVKGCESLLDNMELLKRIRK